MRPSIAISKSWSESGPLTSAMMKRAEDLKTKAASLAAEGKNAEATAARREAAALSSPPIKVEMSFNVYRTTKGKIGEPVYAEIEAINPRDADGSTRATSFAIKEYYTNQVILPAWILAGSDGSLQIQIRCLTQSQYLGMAESDLYLLASSGNFGFNYMKGLFGVWLQAMVLTAIGVFAGTFLSWPVALLTTIFFFVAGQLAFAFLVDFSRQAIMGGGPFESLIRIVVPRQPDVRAHADRGGRARQDPRFTRHARDVDARVPGSQFPGARRQQPRGRRLHGELASHHLQCLACPGLRSAVLICRLSHPEEPGSRSMNALSNFNRKLIYGMIIVAIFGVMFPYTGWLAAEKKRRDLGEAAIGQIDTGSFMMKLFLLGGFRGIVADILWIRAEEQKKDHDWDRLKTTVELITKLQPHFLSIWTFQGWNLAYNVSVEWDAPEDKYTWIKEGIKFLEEGVAKNRRSPDLIWDTAWTYYHKTGLRRRVDHPAPARSMTTKTWRSGPIWIPQTAIPSSPETTSSWATAGLLAP